MKPAAESLQLRDIHLPPDIGWWPPAAGWWIVAGLILLLSLLGFLLYRYWQGRQLYRVAISELTNIKTAYAQHTNDQLLVQELSIWLRRVCLACYPREEVAGLTGQGWLAFLDQTLANRQQPLRFSEQAGQIIIQAPYQPTTRVDADGLLSLCQIWLKCLPRQKGLAR